MTNPENILIEDSCSYPDCGRYVVTRGLCPSHYAQERAGTDLREVGQHPMTYADSECSLDGCENVSVSKELCAAHYQQSYHGRPFTPTKQHPKTPCTEEGCANRAKTSGRCAFHYSRSLKRRGCEFPDCEREHESRGYCKTHAYQLRKGKELTPIRAWGNYNTVVPCKVEGCTRRAISDSLCTTHHPMRSGYGLSIEQMSEMLKIEACQVCGSTKRLCIDHDHACCPGSKACGKCVRGRICTNCNSALGHAKDDIDRLKGLIAYLERWESREQA